MLFVLCLLQTRQRSNHLKGIITRKRDTELNNPQRQGENKSSEKSNEKNGSSKEKKIVHQKKIVYQQIKITKVFTY